jgi:nucleotide-binding universal stress UspA family protein
MPDTVTLEKDGSIQTCGEIDVNYVKSQKDIADRKLQNLKNLYGDHIHVHLAFGKTTNAISSFAELNKYDLVVMGTKGATGLKERVSGTETQMVARHCQVPVLRLMCDRSELEVHNVLLVHDFTTAKPEDLRLLRRLVSELKVKIHLLQIVKTNAPEAKDAAIKGMENFAKLNEIAEFVPHTILDKDVEKGVVHFNQMMDMDIICIGTHAKGGFLHHSATEALINHMFKPIISFHLKNN